MGKRLAYVLVTPELIGALARNGKHNYIVESEVPEDAEFYAADFDLETRCFRVMFEHESFCIVPEGAIVPRLNTPQVTTVIHKITCVPATN